MDDVSQLAIVSKPTLYRYFNDKEHLFAEVVPSTTREIDEVARLVADTLRTVQTRRKVSSVLRAVCSKACLIRS